MVLANASPECTPHQAVKCVQSYVLKCFANLLDSKDRETIQVVLGGIHNILKNSQSLEEVKNPFVDKLEPLRGVEKLETLQSRPSHEFYEISFKILEGFFVIE